MSLPARRAKQSPVPRTLLRRKGVFLFLLAFIILLSCSPSAPLATPQLITVYSTSAAEPWLPPLYVCAQSLATLSRVDNPEEAEIILRVGEPEFLDLPAFQIDTEEILIVTHRQSPVQNLSLEKTRSLFMGQGDQSVQVWVYAPGEDLQQVFDRVVMTGGSVTPSARIAVHPQQMSDTLVNESNSVGILPRHWKVGDVREVLVIASVPVLAMTDSEPEGTIRQLIGCLQN